MSPALQAIANALLRLGLEDEKLNRLSTSTAVAERVIHYLTQYQAIKDPKKAIEPKMAASSRLSSSRIG